VRTRSITPTSTAFTPSTNGKASRLSRWSCWKASRW
jgi:hypothetical protein